MPYVMRGADGQIQAIRPTIENAGEAKLQGWVSIEGDDAEYIAFLERELQQQDPFRESDIHLARVLEDLISLLIDKQAIRFSDFPAPAQKRLLERQRMRKNSNMLNIIDLDDKNLTVL